MNPQCDFDALIDLQHRQGRQRPQSAQDVDLANCRERVAIDDRGMQLPRLLAVRRANVDQQMRWFQ